MKPEPIRLPRMFFDDHVERDLPAPEVVRENSRSVWVIPEGDGWEDLIGDAWHYSDPRDGWADDSTRFCYAAQRLLKAAGVWK